MADKKEDCKYWDKCYQKNEAHIKKFNHPPKTESKLDVPSTEDSTEAEDDGSTTPKSPNKKLSPLSTKSPKQSRSSREEGSPKLTLPTPNKELMVKRSPDPEVSPNTAKRYKKSPSKTKSEKEVDNIKESVAEQKNADEPPNTDKSQEKEKVISSGRKKYLQIFNTNVCSSKKSEYIELLKTPDFIRHKFLVEMPEEFYTFWVFCTSLVKNDKKPEEVFKTFGLQLVGPFEYLAGHFNEAKIVEPSAYLRHWRFYYDPPEFQTVIVKKGSGLHYGYWRDDPKDKENLLLAQNDANKNCEFNFIGGNCFQALLHYLEKDYVSSPFTALEARKMKKAIEDFAKEHDIPLNNFEDIKHKRDKQVVTKTFHKAGIVVPYDRKTQQGYRHLLESDNELKKILNKFEQAQGNSQLISSAMELLQPTITAANIAVDECDFGTIVELGINLFCSGHKELHNIVTSLLIPGYSLLKRPQFIAIIKSHLENRRKSNNLSILESK